MIEKNMLVWVFVFEGVFDKKVVTEETGNQMRSGKLFCLLTESSSAVEKLQCGIQTHTYTQRHVNILVHKDRTCMQTWIFMCRLIQNLSYCLR